VAAEKIRELAVKVVVKPSDEGFKIELQGRQSPLMGAPNVSPNMRIAARASPEAHDAITFEMDLSLGAGQLRSSLPRI